MTVPRRTLLPAAALCAAALVAGCGSSDKGSDAAKGNGPAQTMVAAAPTTTAAAKPAAGGPQKVAIKDFDYSPRKLTVAVGTKVTWTNADTANHTVTFDTGAKKDLGSESQGASRSFTFAKAGTFAYHCDFHPNMHGMVVVR